jgi:cytochrome c2
MTCRRLSLFLIWGAVKSALCVLAVMVLGSSSARAAGDVVAGKQVFATTCGACHSTEPGVNKIGPSLARIFGSKSGSCPWLRLLSRPQGGEHHLGRESAR